METKLEINFETKLKQILCKRYNFNKEKDFYYKSNDITVFNYFINKYNIIKNDDKTVLFHILNLDYHQYNNTKIDNFQLVISLYNEKKIDRSLELLLSLSMNLKNKYISKIHILHEFFQNKPVNDNMSLISEIIYLFKFIYKLNIEIEYIYDRPSFKFLFNYCNHKIKDKTILSNSDIIYDNTLSKIKNLNNDHFLCISRNNKHIENLQIKWDTIKLKHRSQLIENIFSQDTWIFHSPLKYPINIDIQLGEMFCDSYLNYKLSKSPYNCYNLSKDINCFHIQDGASTSDVISKDEELCKKKLNVIYEKENGNTEILIGLKISSIDEFNRNINKNQL